MHYSTNVWMRRGIIIHKHKRNLVCLELRDIKFERNSNMNVVHTD